MEIVGSFAFDTIYMRFLVICLLSGNFWFRFVGFFLNENLPLVHIFQFAM